MRTPTPHEDLLIEANRLLGEYARLAQRPSTPLIDVACHLVAGGLSDDEAILAAIDHPELLGWLNDGDAWCQEQDDIVAAARDLGILPHICTACERDELTCSLDPCPDVIADRED